MKVFYSEKHLLHHPEREFTGGDLIPAYDQPCRTTSIAKALQENGAFELSNPSDSGLAPITRIHDEDYLAFLKTCYSDWRKAGLKGDAMASNTSSDPRRVRPNHIEGLVGYYANASDTAVASGTWPAAYESAQCAINAADYVSNAQARYSFALCRPPGHHCEAGRFGGYCYLNNAAIATQRLLDNRAGKVAILDIDFHHGNGTQSIFYDRLDVFYASIHGDPAEAYPFFFGSIAETGSDEGAGCNINIPLPPGTSFDRWFEGIETLLTAINDFDAEALVVSLGVDTFKEDPQSFFELSTNDYFVIGNRLHDIGLPIVVIMEGGYHMEAIAPCVLGFLQGLEGAKTA